MKIIIAFTFLLISLFTHAQDNERTKDSLELFAPTPKGAPDGELISKRIGKEGGKIISADKKAELIIPAGALSSETMITIQPVVNLAAGGFGKTYRFEPSGLHFLQPAKLVFHYTDEDAEDGSPQIMSISSQDENGRWFRIGTPVRDTVAKTITATTFHFSEFVETYDLIIHATKKKIKVGNEMVIRLFVVPGNFPEADFTFQSMLRGLMRYFSPQDQNPLLWTVNLVPDGDAINGTINKPQNSYNHSVLYKAPQNIPEVNPVNIRVEIQGVQMSSNTYGTIWRKCKVLVVGNRYKVDLISQIDDSAGSVLGNVFYDDEGSFIVSMDQKETKVIDIVNTKNLLTYTGKCTIVKKHEGDGMINIVGVGSITVTPPELPLHPFAIVDIIFLPSRIDMTVLEFTCPLRLDGKGGTFTSSDLDMGFVMPGPALPIRITFETKEGEQRLEGSYGNRRDKSFQIISVKKLEDE